MAEPEPLLRRYRAMVTMREFELACADGITTGEIRGELHLAVGQEAAAAAMADLLDPEDWLVGTHRSHPALLAKGADEYGLMAEIFEKATGICGGKGGHLHLFSRQLRFSTTGIVGSSLPVALGHAYAARLAGTTSVAVALTGDGGTNAGQFHETLNMAAIWKVPLIVLIENNGYGISVPAADVIAGSLADRVRSYGLAFESVQGGDVDLVAEAMSRAFDHARGGSGAIVVEVICHRHRGHYEGDPDHYRTASLRAGMSAHDPVVNARRRLLEDHDEHELEAIDAEIRDRIAAIRARVASDPAPDPATAHLGVFAEETS